MSSPFFSVVVPTYNRADLISETIESFLSQTFKDFELIIVDDGSTDNTKGVIKKYLSDRRVQYLYQENKERGAARNRGAQASRGTYLLFFDSDDIALPQHLEKAYDLIMKHGVQHVPWMYGNYNTLFKGQVSNTYVPPFSGWITKQLAKGNFTCILTIFLRKDFFETLLFSEDRNLSIVEDWELVIRASMKAPILYQPISTVLVRQHANRSMAFPDKIAYANTELVQKIIEDSSLDVPAKLKKVIAQNSFLIIAIAYFSNANQKDAKTYFKKALNAKASSFLNPKMMKWFIRIYLLPFRNFHDRFSKIFYLTYNGLCQPLGRSQVIPYIIGLSHEGYRFTILSFEHHYEKDFETEFTKVKEQLDNAHIKWIPVTYHKYPRVLSSLYDIVYGFIRALTEFIIEPYGVVHARSSIVGALALPLKKAIGINFIFDTRDLVADAKVDAGQWTNTSMIYKMTKWAEKEMLKNADSIVVLTEKFKTYLKTFRYINAPITVIPTCVDMTRFSKRDDNQRNVIRKALNLSNRLVIVYSGSLGTWYMFEQMIEYFKVIKALYKEAFFLILNKNAHNYAIEVLNKYSIVPTDYLIKSINPDDMYKYLWASDIGIFLYAPTFSRITTFPTKLAEYLACGLPVIGNAGVGDVEEILEDTNIGVVIHEFNENEYKQSFEQAKKLLYDPDFRSRSYSAVKEFMSLEVGVRLYKSIYDTF